MSNKKVFATIIVLLFIGDYYGKINVTPNPIHFIEWPELVLVILLIFGLVGDRITKLGVGKEGFSIEQRVCEINRDFTNINRLGEYGNKNDLTKLLIQVSAQEDIGYRLLVYRLLMRVLLRRICRQNEMPIVKDDDEPISLQTMINFIMTQDQPVLNRKLLEDIDYIRERTYFLEWGAKDTPSSEEIQQVLIMAPTVLLKIIDAAK